MTLPKFMYWTVVFISIVFASNHNLDGSSSDYYDDLSDQPYDSGGRFMRRGVEDRARDETNSDTVEPFDYIDIGDDNYNVGEAEDGQNQNAVGKVQQRRSEEVKSKIERSASPFDHNLREAPNRHGHHRHRGPHRISGVASERLLKILNAVVAIQRELNGTKLLQRLEQNITPHQRTHAIPSQRHENEAEELSEPHAPPRFYSAFNKDRAIRANAIVNESSHMDSSVENELEKLNQAQNLDKNNEPDADASKTNHEGHESLTMPSPPKLDSGTDVKNTVHAVVIEENTNVANGHPKSRQKRRKKYRYNNFAWSGHLHKHHRHDRMTRDSDVAPRFELDSADKRNLLRILAAAEVIQTQIDLMDLAERLDRPPTTRAPISSTTPGIQAPIFPGMPPDMGTIDSQSPAAIPPSVPRAPQMPSGAGTREIKPQSASPTTVPKFPQMPSGAGTSGIQSPAAIPPTGPKFPQMPLGADTRGIQSPAAIPPSVPRAPQMPSGAGTRDIKPQSASQPLLPRAPQMPSGEEMKVNKAPSAIPSSAPGEPQMPPRWGKRDTKLKEAIPQYSTYTGFSPPTASETEAARKMFPSTYRNRMPQHYQQHHKSTHHKATRDRKNGRRRFRSRATRDATPHNETGLNTIHLCLSKTSNGKIRLPMKKKDIHKTVHNMEAVERSLHALYKKLQKGMNTMMDQLTDFTNIERTDIKANGDKIFTLQTLVANKFNELKSDVNSVLNQHKDGNSQMKQWMQTILDHMNKTREAQEKEKPKVVYSKVPKLHKSQHRHKHLKQKYGIDNMTPHQQNVLKTLASQIDFSDKNHRVNGYKSSDPYLDIVNPNSIFNGRFARPNGAILKPTTSSPLLESVQRLLKQRVGEYMGRMGNMRVPYRRSRKRMIPTQHEDNDKVTQEVISNSNKEKQSIHTEVPLVLPFNKTSDVFTATSTQTQQELVPGTGSTGTHNTFLKNDLSSNTNYPNNNTNSLPPAIERDNDNIDNGVGVEQGNLNSQIMGNQRLHNSYVDQNDKGDSDGNVKSQLQEMDQFRHALLEELKSLNGLSDERTMSTRKKKNRHSKSYLRKMFNELSDESKISEPRKRKRDAQSSLSMNNNGFIARIAEPATTRAPPVPTSTIEYLTDHSFVEKFKSKPAAGHHKNSHTKSHGKSGKTHVVKTDPHSSGSSNSAHQKRWQQKINSSQRGPQSRESTEFGGRLVGELRDYDNDYTAY